MTDSTKPNLEDRIDRYVRRELTAAEARELAQESLDAPELFEELTSAALVQASLSARSVRGGRLVRFPGKAWFAVAGAAAVAAVTLISLYSLRSVSLEPRQPSLTQSRQIAVKPALASTAKPGQPILLASGLGPQPNGRNGTRIFRSPEPDSRYPQPAGSIISIEDGLATISLGSVDGLTKGSELEVFRDARSTRAAGHFIATTVFRERARGRIVGGQEIQVNNQVRVVGAVHLDALLAQVDALHSRGDASAALTMAEKAVAWAETANVPPGVRRKAWERLAALEYEAGSLQAAEKHYQSVIDSLNAEPQASLRGHSVALNNLAVLYMLRGDYDGSEAPLTRAVSASPSTDTTYGRSVNNLGVLAELRGDRRKAEALYMDAQRVVAGGAGSPAQERRVIETNLARIKGSR